MRGWMRMSMDSCALQDPSCLVPFHIEHSPPYPLVHTNLHPFTLRCRGELLVKASDLLAVDHSHLYDARLYGADCRTRTSSTPDCMALKRNWFCKLQLWCQLLKSIGIRRNFTSLCDGLLARGSCDSLQFRGFGPWSFFMCLSLLERLYVPEMLDLVRLGLA